MINGFQLTLAVWLLYVLFNGETLFDATIAMFLTAVSIIVSVCRGFDEIKKEQEK